MDHPYLFEYVSARLHTLVRRCPLPPGEQCSLSPKSADPELFGRIVDFSDAPYDRFVLSSDTVKAHDSETPLILCIAGQFSYGLVFQEEAAFLVGPVRFEEVIYFSHILYPGPTCPIPGEEWLRTVPLCAFREFLSCLLLLHNFTRTGTSDSPFLREHDLVSFNSVSEEEPLKASELMTSLVFENREVNFVHNPYSHEVRECAAIENGDTEELQRVLAEDFTGRYGILSKDPLRQEKNMGIVVITLATRAAIRGGLHPETAFYISDVAIQRMEKLKDVPSVTHTYREVEYHLAQHVHTLKEGKQNTSVGGENLHITRCKDYVFAHLHDPLQVQEIAAAIGLEANYLSALFRRCEHITLKDYILREKVSLAKNLLTYSSYSFTKIAVYLGFSSQSHLGSVFRKVTGMTLKQYRNAYLKEDFVYDQMFRSESEKHPPAQ